MHNQYHGRFEKEYWVRRIYTLIQNINDISGSNINLENEISVCKFRDEPYASHLYFCDRIVKEQLGFLAYDTDELKSILMNGFNVSQDDYTLPKLSQSKIKKLEKQYMNS